MANETKTPPTTPNAAPHNPFAGWDPMTAWATSQQSFQKMFADAYSRAQSFADEYAAIEQQMLTRAQQNIQHWAQLAQDAIAYSSQLSAQARKLSLEAARKMGAGA